MSSRTRNILRRLATIGGAIIIFVAVFSLVASEFKALGGRTSFADVEKQSIETRYPSYKSVTLQRDQFELTPPEIGEVLVPMGAIGFNPWVQATVVNYNMPYEFRVGNLGFPVQFYGDTMEPVDGGFAYTAAELTDVSGAYVVLTSREGTEADLQAFTSGVSLRVLFLWKTPVKDTVLYVYRVEEPSGGVVDNFTLTTTKESILWAITTVNGRWLSEDGYLLQNVLPDAVDSPALVALQSEDVHLYHGNHVLVENIPFILTGYHFTPGHTFIPSSAKEIWLLASWQDGLTPVIHSPSGPIPGQQVLWDKVVGDSTLHIGLIYVPAADGTYSVENISELLGITTR